MQYIILTEPVSADSSNAELLFQQISFSNRDELLRVRSTERTICYGLLSVLLKRGGHHKAAAAGIVYSSNGKPVLSGIENLHFSISHTRYAAAVAIAEHPVGIDIENSVIRRDFMAVSRRFFHPNEIAWLNGQTATELKHSFLRLWTMKESYGKMTGEGIMPQLSQDFLPALLQPEHPFQAAVLRLEQPSEELFSACSVPEDCNCSGPELISEINQWLID